MKNITRRTIVTFFLAAILLAGTGFFVGKLFLNGDSWVSLSANTHIYSGGVLKSGTVMDRDGEVLAASNQGNWTFNDNVTTRRALLHTVGTPRGVISTGAITKFAGKLAGYNLITGAKHLGSAGNNLYLTVDADICRTAYKALGNYKGTVGVYNYKTGEIVCLVSTPTFDPSNPPSIQEDDPNYEGVYVNRFLSSKFIPGSTFKLVTLYAALEEIPDIQNRTFHCDGSVQIGDQIITCTGVHGDLTLEQALNVSCNCAFGQIAEMIGGKKLAKYTQATGLTNNYSVNGITTRASSFNFDSKDSGDIAWAGVGQGKDLVNPCAMMVYMGAIANGGKTAVPQIISKVTLPGGLKTSIYLNKKTEPLITEEAAGIVAQYMKSNVVNNYGESRFPGLDIYGKTGTAQVDSAEVSNSWFAGFIRNENAPYAFVVYAEGGGSGVSTAAAIANTVLQSAVANAPQE